MQYRSIAKESYEVYQVEVNILQKAAAILKTQNKFWQSHSPSLYFCVHVTVLTAYLVSNDFRISDRDCRFCRIKAGPNATFFSRHLSTMKFAHETL